VLTGGVPCWSWTDPGQEVVGLAVLALAWAEGRTGVVGTYTYARKIPIDPAVDAQAIVGGCHGILGG